LPSFGREIYVDAAGLVNFTISDVKLASFGSAIFSSFEPFETSLLIVSAPSYEKPVSVQAAVAHRLNKIAPGRNKNGGVTTVDRPGISERVQVVEARSGLKKMKVYCHCLNSVLALRIRS
jgi:hypothetical protein